MYFTRSRPYRKNDQAYIESKNNHAVRKYGFHYRYDTEEEHRVLKTLWEKVMLKLNHFTPTQKPVGWAENTNGKHRRIRDTPTTDVPAVAGCKDSVRIPNRRVEKDI
ncbi:hypothetical protein [Corynebacterium diphtheriae]|uniref:hypothetical protein n=1 Tax=Corynebacterium belfantii TaxID=2014537 RepID=UPI000B4B13C4|nr:hypothetical protein AZF07_08455 [Corynebacterium diphtheriae subsp. lausannense]STC67793.1 integrase catalytic subunit [Corynebacterium diphtheriae]